MSARGTGVMVALLAALAGYLWVFELGPIPAAPPPAAEAAPLLPGPPTAVVRIEVAEGERHTIAFRGEHGWTDAAGRAWPESAVTDLIAALGALRPLEIIDPDPTTPGDFGLGPGARHLTLAGADGRPLVALELGERNPAGTGLYARRAGESAVLLMGALLGWELEKLRHAAPGTDP